MRAWLLAHRAHQPQVLAGREEAARLRGDLEEARSRATAAAAAAPDAALARELEAANRALAGEVSALRAAAAIAEHGPGNPRVAELEAQVASLEVRFAGRERRLADAEAFQRSSTHPSLICSWGQAIGAVAGFGFV